MNFYDLVALTPASVEFEPITCVRFLPEAALRKLDRGPAKEPECGVCDVTNKFRGVGCADAAAYCLAEWHDEPMRCLAAGWRGGKYTYERCLHIYVCAHRELERRAKGWPHAAAVRPPVDYGARGSGRRAYDLEGLTFRKS